MRFLIWLPWFFLALAFEYTDGDYLSYNAQSYTSFEDVEVYEEIALKGMIVPHHTVPMDKLIKMYKTASNDARHVLLLSPDHFTSSPREVITSGNDWQGQFGVLKANLVYQETLEAFDFVYSDKREVYVEHGLTTHIPLIKKYFDKAKLNVLAVSKQVRKVDLERLINSIPEDTFVIASVDFSHYYDLNTANAFDEETLKIINRGEYEQFFGMSDAYFDTPGVLFSIFSWANDKGFEFSIYDHSNSALYFKENIRETTSYYFIGFYK